MNNWIQTAETPSLMGRSIGEFLHYYLHSHKPLAVNNPQFGIISHLSPGCYNHFRTAAALGYKPYLTLLQDITDEQCKVVADLAGLFYSLTHELKVQRQNPEKILVWDYTQYGHDIQEADRNGSLVVIWPRSGFEIYTTDGPYGEYPLPLEVQPNVPSFQERMNITHYLLKEQFDLFNLVDEGLAFDIKTLPVSGDAISI